MPFQIIDSRVFTIKKKLSSVIELLIKDKMLKTDLLKHNQSYGAKK